VTQVTAAHFFLPKKRWFAMRRETAEQETAKDPLNQSPFFEKATTLQVEKLHAWQEASGHDFRRAAR
jgi:hypothetical protein